MIEFANKIDNKAFELVRKEYLNALYKRGSFHSAHEGFAILMEEVDELWAAVKIIPGDPDKAEMILEEAQQVAAMAIRMMVQFGGFKK